MSFADEDGARGTLAKKLDELHTRAPRDSPVGDHDATAECGHGCAGGRSIQCRSDPVYLTTLALAAPFGIGGAELRAVEPLNHATACIEMPIARVPRAGAKLASPGARPERAQCAPGAGTAPGSAFWPPARCRRDGLGVLSDRAHEPRVVKRQ